MVISLFGGKRALGPREAAFLEIIRELAAEDDLERLFTLIGEQVCRLLGTDSASLCVVDGDELVYRASYGMPAEAVSTARRRRIAESRVGRVILSPRSYSTPDTTQDPYWRDSEVVTRWGYRAILEVPVVLRGEVIGALAALHKAPRSFSEEDMGLLSALADHTALALDRTRLLKETQARLLETKTLLVVGQAVSSTLDLTEVLRRVARETGRALGADMVGAYLPDPDEKHLQPVAGWHVPKHLVEAFKACPIPLQGHRILEEAWAGRRPVWSSHVAADPRIDRASFERFPHQSNLFFPIIIREKPIGGLFVTWWAKAHEFTPAKIRLVEGISYQVGLAIENARLYRGVEQQRREAEMLAEIARSITASLDLDTTLQRVAEGAKELCRSDIGEIALPDSDGALHVRYTAGARYQGYEALHVEAGKGIGGLVLATGRSFRTDNYAEDPRISKDYLAVIREEGIIADLAVPIRTGDHVVGVLYSCNRSPRPFTDRDEAVLQRLADHAAIAIQNARLYEESNRRRVAAERLTEIGRFLSETVDPREVARRIVESVRALLKVVGSALFRLEPESRDLVSLAVAGDLGPSFGPDIVFPRSSGLVGLAVQDGCTVQSSNVLADPRVTWTSEMRARVEQGPFRAVLAVPLRVRDRAIGALGIVDRLGRLFSAEEIHLAETFAAQAAVVLENARLYDEIKSARDFLQSITESSPDAIVTTDAHGRFTHFGLGAEEIFGYRAEEILGSRVADYYRGGLDEARAVMRRLKAEGRIRNYETTFRAKDGRWVEVNLSLTLLRDTSGEIVGTLAVARDETERRLAEEALRESEERFRRAFEDTAVGMALQAPDGRYVRVNRALCEMVGYSEQELLGMTWREITHPDDLAADAEHERRMLAGEIDWYQLEKRYLHRDGRSVVWTLIGVAAVRARDWSSMYLVVQVQDITERKRAEEKLRQLAERVSTLREIDRAILAARSPAEIARASLRHLRRLIPTQRASVTVFAPEAGQAVIIAVERDGGTRLPVGTRIPLDAFVDIEALRRGEVSRIEDLAASTSPVLEALVADGIRSALYAPLLAHGEPIGTLNLGAGEPGAFSSLHVQIAREVADSLAVALHNARLFDQVREARDRLYAVARQLVEVQEAERRHLARELHDEIGQILTALKLTLERPASRNKELVGRTLTDAQGLVSELMGHVRELSLDLRPAMLDDLGLLPTLLWYLERYRTRTGVEVAFKHTGLDWRFPPQVETAAYRIIQEALSNVARHARTREAKVWILADDRCLSIQIEDEGVGFDAEAVLSSNITSGLAGIRERAVLLDGRFAIESAPGAGTRLAIILPLTTRP